jgi:hypothetical protein
VKDEAISFLREAFPKYFLGIKIIPTNSLKAKNSSDYNGITIKFLKVCVSLISRALPHIFNHSLSTRIFPDFLKISAVRPLHKNGNKYSMSNYRSVSLLTAFSKVFEKVMHNRVSH